MAGTVRRLQSAYRDYGHPPRRERSGGVGQRFGDFLHAGQGDAVALLDVHLSAHREDQDARWLLLHALYAQFVKGGKPLSPVDAQRFATHARLCIDARSTNSALAAEWLKVISSSA